MTKSIALNEIYSCQSDGQNSRLIKAFDWLLERMDQARERRALAQLDDRDLKDLGLTRGDLTRLRP